MTGRAVVRSHASVAAVATLALSLVGAAAHAGTTGKLAGIVLDAKKQPLAGANVALPEARLGTVSGADGRYAIFNVPAGTYTLRVGLIGYATSVLTGVAIPADRTTTADVSLQESAVPLQEVVVSARRPVVELGLTSNVATLTRDEINKLPVQALDDVVNLQAGVVDGHFRGGRKGEVQYQIDGVSVNNPYDNASTVRLDRSVLEEVQVISGTFDAEYGQAMSGVVNAVLRRGTEQFAVSGEVSGGAYAYGNSRPDPYSFRPGDLQNYQLTVSGPTGLPQTVFLASGRYGIRNGYLYGLRRLVNVDRSDPDTIVFTPATQVREAVGYTREWLVLGKLSTRFGSGASLSYQGILNGVETRKENWDYRLNIDGLPRQRTFSAVHGLEWTHALNPSTFYRFILRQNYFDYHDMVFDNLSDSRYDINGSPTFLDGYEYNAILYGVDETRFIQNTSAIVIGGSVNRIFGRDHQVKAGIEWQPTRVEFGHPGYLVWTGNSYVRHVDDRADGFPPPQAFTPVIGSSYAQDDIEWNDLRFRAGLRFDYFNPMALVPGDPLNPANTIPEVTPVPPREATRKLSLSPRLGVSYPVTAKSSLFFAYGHFYQMPQLGQMFANADYSVLATLAASSGKDYGVLGNPDVKPEKSIQYQFGYKQQLKDWLGLDVTLFYKDIRDLLGTEILTTYNNALYKRLTNVDFGNVIGFTVALDQRALGVVSTSLDYTWQVANGNTSDPYETAARVDAHEDPRPRQIPLTWDQRHTLNLTVTLARPRDYTVGGVLRAASGQPYTPESESGFGGTLETNSGRKPAGFLVDLRGEKTIGHLGAGWNVFANLYNAFDTRFFNGTVFPNSGSPYYSRTDTAADRKDLANPTRYYGPRRVELGIRWERDAR